MTPNLFDLTGKLAVVTGASRGVGFAMAGADIIGVSASLQQSGRAIGDRVAELGREFTAYTVDFGDRYAVLAFVEQLTSAERPVDILVNNAGTIERALAASHPLELWDHVINVNLSSQFALTQAVDAQIITRCSGKVIFTASLLNFQGGINVPGYTASTSAIAGLTKALANEWTSQGVTVSAIAPGYIATDNTRALQDDPARSRAILERIPAGRWGRASDLAEATVFLASEASDYVSGITLVAIISGVI